MKNIKQIELLKKVFTHKRNALVSTIMILNNKIKGKKSLLEKISLYQLDYIKSKNNVEFEKIPLFINNKSLFINKIFELMEKEEHDIKNLNVELNLLLNELKTLDSKLSVMGTFADRFNAAKAFTAQNSELKQMDDLLIANEIWKSYD